MKNALAIVPVAEDKTTVQEAAVRQCLPLVKSIARRIRSSRGLTTPLEDLCAIGVTGVLQAVERFDSRRGVTFITFAYYRIRGAILDSLRREASRNPTVTVRERATGPISTSAYLALPLDRRAHNDNGRADHRAHNDNGRAVAAEPPQETTVFLSDLPAVQLRAMDVGLGTDERGVDPEGELDRKRLADRLLAAMAALPERERQVVELYYFGDHSFESIGEKLGMCKPWAFRLHARAVLRLRKALGGGPECAALAVKKTG